MPVVTLEELPSPIVVKVDTLTLGEVEEFEEMTGLSVAVLSDEERPKGKVLRALTWLSLSRDGYEIDFDDLKGLSLDQIEFEGGEDEDPTDAS